MSRQKVQSVYLCLWMISVTIDSTVCVLCQLMVLSVTTDISVCISVSMYSDSCPVLCAGVGRKSSSLPLPSSKTDSLVGPFFDP